MRGIGAILVWLAVMIGMVLPGFGHGIGHASDLTHSHATTEQHHEQSELSASWCEGGDCAEHSARDECLVGAAHCITAIGAPVREASLVRLPRDAGHGFHPAVSGPHRMPETETPPPRV